MIYLRRNEWTRPASHQVKSQIKLDSGEPYVSYLILILSTGLITCHGSWGIHITSPTDHSCCAAISTLRGGVDGGLAAGFPKILSPIGIAGILAVCASEIKCMVVINFASCAKIKILTCNESSEELKYNNLLTTIEYGSDTYIHTFIAYSGRQDLHVIPRHCVGVWLFVCKPDPCWGRVVRACVRV